jgi:AraC family transcriptional regulator
MEQYRRRTSAIKPVLTAVRWIEENLEKRITNEQLASLCSLSEDHFIRRFHNALGLPPAQYVMKQRLAKAGQHLLFTDLTIDEIAAITGFGDRFYFSRVFARETGLPPAAYRRGGRT